MLSSRLAAQGALPPLSGFYWYSPGQGSLYRGVCERREGEDFVRMPDGVRVAAVSPGDRFFGPIQPPDEKWTLYWNSGTRQVIEGEDAFQAMTNAGMRGANPYRTLCVPGDDHSYVWCDTERRWRSLEESRTVAEALPS